MAKDKQFMGRSSARVVGSLALLATLGGCQSIEEQGSDPTGIEERESAGEGSIDQAAQPLELQARRHRIAGGNSHALTIRQNGTVWAWGVNANGQLGDGTTTSRSAPVQIASLTSIVSVAAGAQHSVAVRADGSVWTWGYNYYGQLGDGTKAPRLVPVQVGGLTGVVTVAASNHSSLALKADGTVWAWGNNSSGQVGNGAVSPEQTIPTQVTIVGGAALNGIVAISAGTNFAMALKADGTVWTWGANASGQLGIGALTTQETRAVQAVGLTGVASISAGSSHAVALQSNGAVYTWGVNGNGQLGIGTTANATSPQLVSGVSNVKAIAAGNRHTLALKADGTAAAWGYNALGQLGLGNFTTQFLAPFNLTPTALAGAEELAAGAYSSYALLSTGGVIKAWGNDSNGEVGNGGAIVANTYVNTPTSTTALSGQTSVAVGDTHTVALKWDGTVWAWGDNEQGQIGDGTESPRLTPVQVRTSIAPTYLTSVIAVAGGAKHTLALKSDGTVWAWGYNDEGQIGDGTINNQWFSTQVKTGPAAFLSGVVALAAGDHHSLALRYDGTVYAWGSDDVGQLGLADGLRQDRAYATPVANLGNVVAIASGGSHSIAVQSNGAVHTWGNGASGQLCDGVSGSGHDSDVVAQVPGVTTATRTGVSAAAGAVHTLLLMSDGTLFACGGNTYGQLGDNTNNTRSSAAPVLNLSNPVRVAAGGRQSLVVTADGSVWAWGRNNYGQLGDSTVVDRWLPTQIAFPGVIGNPLATGIAAGLTHSIAVRPDGLIWGWGRNNDGQLGDGTLVQRNSPTLSTFTP